MNSKVAMGIAALAVTAACASSGGARGPLVSDADLGRLGPGQTGPVDEARQYLASARDELARAKLRLQQGEHETQLAKADETVAAADAQRAQAVSNMATQSRDPTQLDRARQLTQQTQLQKAAADAHAAYAQQLNEANKTSVDAASKQVDLANARLELAKLQALIQANIPAATKYDLPRFQARVNDAQRAFDTALQNARQQHAQASADQQAWQNAQRQLQASGGGVQAG